MSSVSNRTVWMVALAIGLVPFCAHAQDGLAAIAATPTPTVSAPQIPVVPATQPPVAPAAQAPAVPAVQPPLVPSAAPAVMPDEEGWINVQAPDEAATMGEEKSDEVTATPEKSTMSNEQILAVLRGNTQRPLTVADLAAVNDMLKRLEYQAQVEKKMAEMKLGVLPSGTTDFSAPVGGGAVLGGATPGFSGSPISSNNNSRSVAQRYAIVRVFGSKGQYFATVAGSGTDGVSRQQQVRVGDTLDGARVVAISINGVKISDAAGIQDLAFISPVAVNGVSVSANPVR